MRKVVWIIGIILFGGIIRGSYEREILRFEKKGVVLVAEESFKIENKENMQGIAYNERKYYVGYDMRNGNGVIDTYTEKGKFLKRSNTLKIGHSAELSFNKNDGYIYVANGGGRNKAKVYVVDIKKNMKVIKEYDFGELGNSALITVDDEKNEMILHTSKNDKGEHIFSRVTMEGALKEKIVLENLGVPQGLEYFKEYLYFYTNNRVWIIDFKEKKVVGKYNIDQKGESEGITFVKEKDHMYVSYGYNKENRIYRTKIL